MVATELLKLAMETEKGRKERLKKMVANHSVFFFYISNLLSYIQIISRYKLAP